MKTELISILNWLVSLNPEKCNQILYAKYQINKNLVFKINFKKFRISEIIPFFWQYPDPWGSVLPGAYKGYSWLLLSKLIYDYNNGITSVIASVFHSIPPDCVEVPIEDVDDCVLVAAIQLLLEELICDAKHNYAELFRLVSLFEHHKSGNLLSKIIKNRRL